MFNLWTGAEACQHVCGIANVPTGGLLQEVEFANHSSIVEVVVKVLRLLVPGQELAGCHWDVLDVGVLLEVQVFQNGVNQLG